MLIGEVAEQSGISARMLRHYDSIGLVSPTGRTQGGYRQYSAADVLRLFHVEGLRSLGLSLRDVADALGDPSFSPAVLVAHLLDRTQQRLAEEQELLDRLSQVRASNPAAWSDVMRTVGLMRRLGAGDPSTRQHVALSFTSERAGDAVPLVEAALNERDPNVAGALYWALARIGDSAIPPLAMALDSADSERRRRAMEALVKIGSPCATAALAEAARNPDPLVSGRAILTRAARGDDDTIPALVALVVEGRDDVDAADALAALAIQHDCADTIVDTIAAALRDATDPVRRRLAAALAGIPGRRADETLDRLAIDPYPGVAATASFLLTDRSTEIRE